MVVVRQPQTRELLRRRQPGVERAADAAEARRVRAEQLPHALGPDELRQASEKVRDAKRNINLREHLR